MSVINILHISDFHDQGEKAFDQRIVLETFLSDIEKSGDDIDIIIFSGDLVQAGTSKDIFEQSINTLINKTADYLKVSASNIFLVPGNHDINRDVVREKDYVELGLRQSLNDRDKINSFIDKNINIDIRNETLPEPLERLKSFYHGVWGADNNPNTVITPFFLIRTVEVNGISVAVCCFNSAWRCTGEAGGEDSGRLIIGERAVDLAIQHTKDATIRIAVFHHPFDWLTEADRAAVEARFHAEFDAFFFGHVHTTVPSCTRTAMGGAVYSQAGCLYANRNYYNGYNIVSLNIPEAKVRIRAKEYSDRVRSFIPALAAIPNGEVEFSYPFSEGRNGGNLMALLAAVRPSVKRLGDEHVRLTSDENIKLDLEKHFVCPPLTRPRRISEEESDLGDEARSDELTLIDLLNSDENLVIVGPSESGKTSLIHYAALKSLEASVTNKRLPLRARFHDFQRGKNVIWRAVRAYANEISDAKISSSHIEKLPILLFVDEVAAWNDDQLSFVLDEIAPYKNIRLILVADGRGSLNNVSAKNEEKLKDFNTVSVNDLSRSTIRRLSAQWLGQDIETEQTNNVFNKVMDHIAKSGLPRSGYIVSLILWTLKSESAGELINEAVLLENIIDYMLGKMDYRDSARSEFDFQSKVAVLQELSTKLSDTTQSLSKNEINRFVIDFLERKGLKYDGALIVEGLIKCGILSQIDDVVDFRYRRFREYFSAGFLRDNQKVVDIINGEDCFSYSRVLDIYTSRFRHESHLLPLGRSKLDEIVIRKPKLEGDALQSYLSAAVNLSAANRRLDKMKKEPMSARKIDEFRDKADASIRKKRSDLSIENKSAEDFLIEWRNFISALVVYSNFIRNIEFADNKDKKEHLSYCIDKWVYHAKIMMGGLNESFKEININIDSDEDLEELDRSNLKQLAI